MVDALKGLFSSKTFYLAIIGSAVVVALAGTMGTLGVPADQSSLVLTSVATLFGIKGAQQALADIGKEKARLISGK